MVQEQQQVIDGLSRIIAKTLRSHHSERHHPGHNADAMDDKIKLTGEQAIKLRQIRNQLEDIFTEGDVA
jgi:hypothetical protein